MTALDDDLRAFVAARLDEDEADAQRRGLALWRRDWERAMVERGSPATLRLIASGWAGHPNYRDEWRPPE